MKILFFCVAVFFMADIAQAQQANEKLFKEMILNLPNYRNQPGTNFNLIFDQFTIGKPTTWVMEYGNSPAQDKNTKVYKVVAGFTLFKETYNTKSGQKYSSSSKKYKRPYHFYIDKTGNWVCIPVGLSSGYY